MEQIARDRAASMASSNAPGGHRRTASTKSAGKPLGSTVTSLFLTNLRLLDFDLLPDWPGITTASLGNQDARARIRCTEFSLFHLFKLYDQYTAADKLLPFYPPLELLQSINLRAALYRCLNELKKNGVLGKETVLRKTMLDECKDDKFWEASLAFSAIVLRKVTLERKHTDARHRHGGPVAERLGTAAAVSKAQMESLIPLAIAHKAALGKILEEKQRKRETFGRLYDVLAEKEAGLAGRKARVQEQSRSRPSQAQLDRLSAVATKASKSWVGSKELQQALLGNSENGSDAVLTQPLEKVAEGPEATEQHAGLLQSLEQTARRQSQRVRRWQSMHEQMLASKQTGDQTSSSTGVDEATRLRFDKHRALSLRDAPQPAPSPPRRRSDRHAALSKYDETLTAMREELHNNRRATASTPSPTKPFVPPQRQPPTRKPSVHLDTSAGAPDPHQRSPSQTAVPMRPAIGRRVSSRSRSYHPPKVEGQRQPIPLKSEIFSPLKSAKRRSCSSPLSSSSMLATPVEEIAPDVGLTAHLAAESRRVSQSSEANSAIDSGVGLEIEQAGSTEKQKDNGPRASSGDAEAETIPVPDREFKKPALPSSDNNSAARPSLAERTRMSMAFRSTEDVHGILPEPSMSAPAEAPHEQNGIEVNDVQQTNRRTTLLDRTRHSISLAPGPAPAKPSHTRTRSSIYPINQFNTPQKPDELTESVSIGAAGRRDITPREQLFSPEAEYDSVFRPRPKVKLSPVLSPSVERDLGGMERRSPLVGRG